MDKLRPDDKRAIAAKIAGFPSSGIQGRVAGSITKYHKSCVGRDFKALAQMAVFVLWDNLNDSEKQIWLLLSKVNNHVYESHAVHAHTHL